MVPRGRIAGEYLVTDLACFANKSLYHRVGPEHFSLQLHRTEVVRNPSNSVLSSFPCRFKYMRDSYTIEGLEDALADRVGGPALTYYSGRCPQLSDEELGLPSEQHLLEGSVEEKLHFGFGALGRGHDVDWDGKGYSSEEILEEQLPDYEWTAHPELHERWRELFPDTLKIPIEDQAAPAGTDSVRIVDLNLN